MPDQPARSSAAHGKEGEGAVRAPDAQALPKSSSARPPAELLASTGADVVALIRKQESLLAFIEAITSELEPRPLLTRILRSACELIGADNGAIGRLDEERGVVRTEAVYNMPADELGAEMPPGVGLAGMVLAHGEPVVLDRYGAVAHPTQLGLLENAVLGMPIHGHGRLIGFFGIGRSAHVAEGGELERPPPFSESDVATLALFARHAAVAIENARLYAEEQARTERLELIARISQIITADLRLSDLLQRSADAIHELLGYSNVAIPLIEPGDPRTLVLRTTGGAYKHIVTGEYRIPIEQGIMGAAVRERRTQLVNDVASDPRHMPTPGAVGIVAELAVPILLGERVMGVLNVESEGPFDEEDAASLQIIADQLAVAIENARLYERGQRVAVLEERQRLARDLHDSVTQHLFGMVLMGESLAQAWRRDDAEGERRAARLVELSRAALAELRAILAELRPDGEGEAPAPEAAAGMARVRRDGLAAALVRVSADMVGEGPRIEIDSSRYEPQPPETEEALYRIVQESLANVVKHAGATTVRVAVGTEDDETVLEVVDDGVGFRQGRRKIARRRSGGSGGLGLNTMRERAEARGGTFRLESAPGQGTRVEVRIPVERGRHR